MPRKRFKKPQEEAELDVTSFMNLMVVLIPFLLATAVFSQVTIQELNMPSAGAAGATPDKPVVTIEVMVRKDAIEISNGSVITHRFPNKDGEYDLDSLTARLLSLKEKHPEKEDATVLLEPDIEYDDMIAVMDTVKFHKVEATEQSEDAADADGAEGVDTGESGDSDEPGEAGSESVVLFPEISIGDAP